jgi:hypothetical protein
LDLAHYRKEWEYLCQNRELAFNKACQTLPVGTLVHSYFLFLRVVQYKFYDHATYSPPSMFQMSLDFESDCWHARDVITMT